MNKFGQSPRSRLYEFDKKNLSGLKRIAVFGDIHGDMKSLSSLLELLNPSEEDGIIFLGDYSDRGDDSIGVINTVQDLMKKYPRNAIALKGNHEDYSPDGDPMFSPCTLITEARNKKGNWHEYFHNEYKIFMDNLYLAAIIPSKFLFVHGGISSSITSLEDLRHPTCQVESDILWSDPISDRPINMFDECPNHRGAGVEFRSRITNNVCESLDVGKIIRSHQPNKAPEGCCYEHNGKVVTVSSTSIYGGRPFVLVLKPSDFLG